MSAKEAPVFHHQTYINSKKIPDISYLERNASSKHPQVLSTSSLLLLPEDKMEVFKILPQENLHFQEVWSNSRPEFREGQALGLMISFANMAKSIQNMRIQDDPQLYQEKMRSLLDLEDNGFEVGALKVRLITCFA